MHPNFSQLTPRWFKRAFVYTGNIDDFRYRFEMDKDNGLLHTAVYTVYCFEVAKDVQQQDFPWDDQGVEQLKAWLQERYEHYTREEACKKKKFLCKHAEEFFYFLSQAFRSFSSLYSRR